MREILEYLRGELTAFPPCEETRFQVWDEFRPKRNESVSGVLRWPQDWDNYFCFTPFDQSWGDTSDYGLAVGSKLVITSERNTLFWSPRMNITEIGLRTKVSSQVSIDAEARKIFSQFRGEALEFGIENPFSQMVLDFVAKNRNLAITAFERVILEGRGSPTLIGEALLWLGDVNDFETHEGRRRLLEIGLAHENISVRGDAITGLKFLNDRKSIVALQAAVKMEEVPALKAAAEDAIKSIE